MVFGFGNNISIGIANVNDGHYSSQDYDSVKKFKSNRIITIGGKGSDIVQKGADNLQCALYYTGIKLWLENIGKKTINVGSLSSPYPNPRAVEFMSRELSPLKRIEVQAGTVFTFGDESKEYTITHVPS